MSLRRISTFALAAALAAGCGKSVSQRSPQSELVIAVFSSPDIPSPNDLALQAAPGPGVPAGALKDLLLSFSALGGFPQDQAPTLTVPLRAYDWNAATHSYDLSQTLPSIDPATLTPETAALFKVDVAPPVRIDVEPAPAQTAGAIMLLAAADATGSRRLAPGRYVFAVRGGALGAKTTTGLPIGADVPIALTIPNKDLSDPANQPPGGLTPAQLAQLVPVQSVLWQPLAWTSLDVSGTKIWTTCADPRVLALSTPPLNCTVPPTPAYTAVDPAFPHAEVASIATFQIAPSAGTVPLVDAASGQAPLPIDLLRTGANGTIAENPAFGPAAAGLATLDGFSTTAMLLAPTSLPVAASSVPGHVLLFKLGAGAPALVPELKAVLGSGGSGTTAGYVAQPTPVVIPQGTNIVPGLPCPAAGGCSPAIGLQPAVPAAAPGGPYYLPPLDENTSYAVVITTSVLDIAGHALARPTIMTLLLEQNPLAVSGHTALPGVLDDATATALETMRGQLVPVLAAVPGGAPAVALAYTFKTQSFKTTSISLAAAPYAIEQGASAAIFTPSATAAVTPPNGIPTGGVNAFYDVTFKSVDAIDKTTGAFRPTLAADLASPTTVPTLLTDLHALVAVPDVANVPDCPVPFPAGTKCARLVVFGHGLNGSKETMFAVASSLASAGFMAAAIDFPLHGSRNWCSVNADCVMPGTTTQGTCTPFTGAAGQGDAVPPGQCGNGSVPATPANSRYFIGANFFRTRDAFRQNVIDVSALVLALARPPTGQAPQPPGNPFLSQVNAAQPTLLVDPTTAYYEGLSLGSISGTSAVASNPRISRASLSVGGGTVADVFTNSPSFQPQVALLFNTLLATSLHGQTFSFDMIDPTKSAFDLGVAEAYLQTLNVAKWVLDPGEPVNFAVNLKTTPLPNLLANPNGSVAQGAKDVYGQVAQNDIVVPNPFNLLLYTLASANQTFYTGANASHGMLATQAPVQLDAVGFLLNPSSPPPTTRNLP